MMGLPAPFGSLRLKAAVLPLDVATYTPHALHRADQGRIWPETNCYVDLWIELLAAAGFDPHAALGFTLATDFEGDQWTFHKFALGDLQRLYGLDTQELSIWRAPHLHALEQLNRGRIVLMEADSFFLPDTQGVSYRLEHVKTTIGIQELDLEEQRVCYFHNAGFFAAQGQDFAGLFRLDDPWTPASLRLLPYTEYVKLDGSIRRSPTDLAQAALQTVAQHRSRRPRSNPFRRYQARFVEDLAWLRASPMIDFHQYAFVSVRQFGSSFELAGDFCRWLRQHQGSALTTAADAFTSIAVDARALQMKIARSVATKKPFDPSDSLEAMARSWDNGMAVLDEVLT